MTQDIGMSAEDYFKIINRATYAEQRAERAESLVRELEAANATLTNERDELKRQLAQAQERIKQLESERVQMLVNSIRGES